MPESISIPIDTPGADRSARNIRGVGDAAAGTAVKVDLAAASLAAFNDASAKYTKSINTVTAAKLSSAKADTLLSKAENLVSGEAQKLDRLQRGLGFTLEDSAQKAEKAASGFSGLAGGGGIPGGGMGAAIAAGAVLSPVIVTLGFGLTGLAAAAYGIAKPIENAAQKTGGLAANLGKLSPEQRTVATSLLALGKSYDAFQTSLQPEVLGIFNTGLRIAGHLMTDVQPVAAATGKALDQLLGTVDREFQSGNWQNFFGFMAHTAAPDIQLLGQTFTNLLDTLPPVLKGLQPVATEFLDIAAAATKIVDVGANLQSSNTKTAQSENFLQKVTGVLFDALASPKGIIWALHQTGLVSSDTGNKVAASTTQWATAAKAADGLRTTTITTAAATDHLGKTAATTSFQVVTYGESLDLAAAHGDHMGKTTDVVVKQMYDAGAAALYDSKVYAQVAHELNVLAAGYIKALTPLENYISANITEANDEKALRAALRASGDTIGYKTQKERDSFSAAQTYISDTIKQGDAALAAHQGINAQITSIKNALPLLESVKGKTAAYKAELDLLKQILDKLRAEKLISEKVVLSGTGTWTILGKNGSLPGKPIPGAAAGGLVGGGIPGRDSVPIMAMPGELVVPTKMVSSGAVDHLRGSIPGFASGGIVPSYSGSVGGLPQWTRSNQQATIRLLSTDMAQAMASAFKSAVNSFSALGSGGPASGTVRQEQAYAASLFRFYGWGANQLPPLVALWNGESGWNPLARNPSSGAFGIPQALPPSKMGALAASGNAAAQIRWGEGYIHSVYGTPANAYGTWLSRSPHWYDKGGWLKPGLNLAYNGTGRPEMVLPPGQGGVQRVVLELASSGRDVDEMLLQILRRAVRIRGGGNVQVALGRP